MIRFVELVALMMVAASLLSACTAEAQVSVTTPASASSPRSMESAENTTPPLSPKHDPAEGYITMLTTAFHQTLEGLNGPEAIFELFDAVQESGQVVVYPPQDDQIQRDADKEGVSAVLMCSVAINGYRGEGNVDLSSMAEPWYRVLNVDENSPEAKAAYAEMGEICSGIIKNQAEQEATIVVPRLR